jgi:hypothetical protein
VMKGNEVVLHAQKRPASRWRLALERKARFSLRTSRPRP